MANFDRNTRFSEYGLIDHFEYKTDDRFPHSVPKIVRLVPNFRFTAYESEVQITYHVVKQGDTIQHLATRYFGDPKLWWFIADYNPTIDFDDLKEDLVLNIQPYSEVSAY